MSPTGETVLTAKEVACMIGLKVGSVRALATRGGIPYIRKHPGSHKRFLLRDVEDLMAMRQACRGIADPATFVRIAGPIALVDLTQGHVAVVDAADADLVKQHLWRYQLGYAHGTVGPMHRFLMNPPEGVLVDHIDGDKANNRRSNLRVCDTSQNAWNAKPRAGTSRYKGVSRCSTQRTWTAQIFKRGRRITIGYYETEAAAAKAYDAAARELFGEFARFNFPLGGGQSEQ